MTFKIEIFSEVELDYLMHGLIEKARDDNRFDIFFINALNSRKHWQMLEFFDGTKSMSPVHREYKQWDSFMKFDSEEIQDYYNFAVNMAILGDPYPGHDVLFKSVANDKNSMFYDSVTPEFKKRLNNGRFWELLGELRPNLNNGLAYSKMEDLLINHFDDLDLNLFPRDFNKRSFNISYLGGGDLRTREKYLSQRAIHQYSRLLEKMDSNLINLKTSEEKFSELVVPYIKTLLGTNIDNIPLMDDYNERLKSPLVEKYEKYCNKQ